jgi:very-short-patch-repair endonuclease
VEEAKLVTAKRLRRVSTHEERVLWESLRTNRFHGIHFRRQQVIDGFVADFYCHSAGIVIEVDGPVHGSQRERDAERDRVLKARGLMVLRVTNDEVRADLGGVLTRILEAIESRSTPLLA